MASACGSWTNTFSKQPFGISRSLLLLANITPSGSFLGHIIITKQACGSRGWSHTRPPFLAFVSFEFANLTLICAQPLVTCCAYRSKYTVEADPAFTCMHTWPFKWCIFSFIPTGPGQELVKHPPSNQTLKLFGRGKKYRYESKIHSQI